MNQSEDLKETQAEQPIAEDQKSSYFRDEFIPKYGVPSAILAGCLMIAIAIFLSIGLPSILAITINGGAAGEQKSGSEKAVFAEISEDDDPFLGDENAPVTIVEFSDFQCPFCRSFWQNALPQIKENYIDKGLVKFVYRDFPLPIHQSAMASAQAAECARDQGKYWEMHDKIFEEQAAQGTGTIQYTASDLKQWAGEIGLNASQFNECLESEKYREEVETDMADGQAAGVNGTPTNFINGKMVRGALPYATFRQEIESALEN